MSTATISRLQLQAMVQHWLATPAGAYLGSAYGHNLPALLQQPMQQAGYGADEVLAKLRHDIPLLAVLPPETIHLYAHALDTQQQQVFLDMAGHTVPLPI